MSADDDDLNYREGEAFDSFLHEQLREIAEAPVFAYLARFGDAIEERVRLCANEAAQLRDANFFGPALVRSTTGIEITIRFFLVQPLFKGAFLSDEWASLLSGKVLKGATAKDREMLPAILRNWGIDITQIKLADGTQMWMRIRNEVWPRRNEYAHTGASVTEAESSLAAECLDALRRQTVSPIAKRLGFTREQTNCWSIVVASKHPEWNPPRRYQTAAPSWKLD